jgi:hypothetical protein
VRLTLVLSSVIALVLSANAPLAFATARVEAETAVKSKLKPPKKSDDTSSVSGDKAKPKVERAAESKSKTKSKPDAKKEKPSPKKTVAKKGKEKPTPKVTPKPQPVKSTSATPFVVPTNSEAFKADVIKAGVIKGEVTQGDATPIEVKSELKPIVESKATTLSPEAIQSVDALLAPKPDPLVLASPSEPEIKAKVLEIKPESELKPESGLKPESELKPESGLKPESEPKPEAGVPVSLTKPQAPNSSEAAVKSEPSKPEVTPIEDPAKPVLPAPIKAEVTKALETSPDIKPTLNSEAKSELKSEPKPVEAKSEREAEVPKPAPLAITPKPEIQKPEIKTTPVIDPAFKPIVNDDGWVTVGPVAKPPFTPKAAPVIDSPPSPTATAVTAPKAEPKPEIIPPLPSAPIPYKPSVAAVSKPEDKLEPKTEAIPKPKLTADKPAPPTPISPPSSLAEAMAPKPSSDPAITPSLVIAVPAPTPSPKPKMKLPTRPVKLDVYAGDYEGQKSEQETRYEQGIREALTSRQTQMGALDGNWVVSAQGGGPLMALALRVGEDRSLEGAWRSLLAGFGLGRSGFISDVSLVDDELTIKYRASVSRGEYSLDLQKDIQGRWRGQMTNPKGEVSDVVMSPQ